MVVWRQPIVISQHSVQMNKMLKQQAATRNPGTLGKPSKSQDVKTKKKTTKIKATVTWTLAWFYYFHLFPMNFLSVWRPIQQSPTFTPSLPPFLDATVSPFVSSAKWWSHWAMENVGRCSEGGFCCGGFWRMPVRPIDKIVYRFFGFHGFMVVVPCSDCLSRFDSFLFVVDCFPFSDSCKVGYSTVQRSLLHRNHAFAGLWGTCLSSHWTQWRQGCEKMDPGR